MTWLLSLLSTRRNQVIAAIVGWVCLMLLACAVVQTVRLYKAQSEVATCHKAAAEFVAKAEIAAHEAAERERQRDLRFTHETQRIEYEHAERVQAYETRIAGLDRRLRAGAVRVRNEVCASGNGLPAPAGPASGIDEEGGLRLHPAVAAVGVGDAATAKLDWCQAYVAAQVKRCNGNP